MGRSKIVAGVLGLALLVLNGGCLVRTTELLPDAGAQDAARPDEGDAPGDVADGDVADADVADACAGPACFCAADPCSGGQVCVDGECRCPAQVLRAEAPVPDVLLVINRTASMNANIQNRGTKWELALAAVEHILTRGEGDFAFGLSVIPDTLDGATCPQGNRCSPGRVRVPWGENTSTRILQALRATPLCNASASDGETLASVGAKLAASASRRPALALLISDGHSPACRDPVPVVAALAQGTPPVPTLVVGFTRGVRAPELEALAVLGGLPRSPSPAYFVAERPEEILDAMRALLQPRLACRHALAPGLRVDAPGALAVHADGQPLETGWSIDAATGELVLDGRTCETASAGGITELAVVSGCETEPAAASFCIVTDGACQPDRDRCCDLQAICTEEAGQPARCTTRARPG